MNLFSSLDSFVFLVYFVVVAGYGLWVYRRKKSAAGSSASHDYFLAEGSLTWWAIGASLIASNISAEQFIGMSGSGYKIGMAIAVYELMAAATLVIVAMFFMPVYLKNHIYTMPQFLEQRYGKAVATTMALVLARPVRGGQPDLDPLPGRAGHQQHRRPGRAALHAVPGACSRPSSRWAA